MNKQQHWTNLRPRLSLLRWRHWPLVMAARIRWRHARRRRKWTVRQRSTKGMAVISHEFTARSKRQARKMAEARHAGRVLEVREGPLFGPDQQENLRREKGKLASGRSPFSPKP